MLPFVYLALPLCQHFHANNKPNRDVARQWFWRNAFGLEDFRSSTDVYSYCESFFSPLEQGKGVTIPRLEISRARLVGTKYNHRNALSRAVLAFLAYNGPIDFSDPNASVLDNVYLLLSQAPNLHHIYPQNFLSQVSGLPTDASVDSLMNICFLRARTNIQISDQNPLVYFKSFQSVKNFESILESHLIPRAYIEKEGFTPTDYRDFLFARADRFAEKLRYWLPNVEVSVVE